MRPGEAEGGRRVDEGAGSTRGNTMSGSGHHLSFDANAPSSPIPIVRGIAATAMPNVTTCTIAVKASDNPVAAPAPGIGFDSAADR